MEAIVIRLFWMLIKNPLFWVYYHYKARRFMDPHMFFDNYDDQKNFHTAIPRSYNKLERKLLSFLARIAAAHIIKKHFTTIEKYQMQTMEYIMLSQDSTFDCIVYFADCYYTYDISRRVRYKCSLGIDTKWRWHSEKDESKVLSL